MEKTTLLIDSNGLAWQAYHAMGHLAHEGVESGVVFGFLSRCLDFGHRFHTNRLVFCWDSVESFRREAYPEYKAQRRKKTDDQVLRRKLYEQMENLKLRILPGIGWKNHLEQVGLEADDMMAEHVGIDSVIVSSDEDMFQCLSKSTRIWNPGKHKLWTANAFHEAYGITPRQWAQVKTLGGCTSDNVQGIRGVGEGTAIKWLRHEMKPGKKLDALAAGLGHAEATYRPLVQLPHSKTAHQALVPDKLRLRPLNDISIEYGFESFKQAEMIQRWCDLFDGVYETSLKATQYNITQARSTTGRVKEKLKRKKKGFGI